MERINKHEKQGDMIERLSLLFEDLIVFQHDLETIRPDLVEDMDKITGDVENLIYKMK